MWAGIRFLTRPLRPVWRALAWPFAKLWAALGVLTRTVLDAGARGWSLVRRVPPRADALAAVVLFAFSAWGSPVRYGNPQLMLIAAQILPLAVVRRLPTPIRLAL